MKSFANPFIHPSGLGIFICWWFYENKPVYDNIIILMQYAKRTIITLNTQTGSYITYPTTDELQFPKQTWTQLGTQKNRF
jgi:hypothetical protein